MTEYTIPSLHIRNHSLAVPLDWSNPTGEAIMLFAREVVDPMRKTENLPAVPAQERLAREAECDDAREDTPLGVMRVFVE